MFENAGGTLPPGSVISRMTYQMTHDHVNIGNPSRPSKSAEKTLLEARSIIETLFNATPQGRVLFGPSSTALIYSMVNVISKTIVVEDEIIVFTAGHEANISPWFNLDKVATIVEWKLTGENDYCSVAELRKLLTPKTRYVALPHASNVTGAVSDLAEVVKCVREVSPKARIFVDGVAYAPHKLVDTAVLDVDFYVVSIHKLYGPHFACMYAKHEAIDELPRIGLMNFPANSPAHFEYGTLQIEALAGIIGIKDLFNTLEGEAPGSKLTRKTLKSFYDKVSVHELALEEILMKFLSSAPNFVVHSAPHSAERRIPIVSFRHRHMSPKKLTDLINDEKCILKHGHFCAPRLIEQLKINEEGVVRASFGLYNTVEDVEYLCSVLHKVDTTKLS